MGSFNHVIKLQPSETKYFRYNLEQSNTTSLQVEKIKSERFVISPRSHRQQEWQRLVCKQHNHNTVLLASWPVPASPSSNAPNLSYSGPSLGLTSRRKLERQLPLHWFTRLNWSHWSLTKIVHLHLFCSPSPANHGHKQLPIYHSAALQTCRRFLTIQAISAACKLAFMNLLAWHILYIHSFEISPSQIS